MTMIFLVLVPLLAAALICLLSRGVAPARWHGTRPRLGHAARYRVQRVRLPHNWWEQFERDFAAYVDPGAARARHSERH
jgi:hypothetical protein